MYSPKKTSSFSTNVNATYASTHTGIKSEKRPQTAKLTYANKPFKKELISWNQSASTWVHSTKKYSFSREKRFRTVEPCSSDIIQPQIPDTKSKKYCSFGKGNKKPISNVVLRNAKQKPAPNAYDISHLDQKSRQRSKGKTFGENWKKYQKLYLSHRKDVYSEQFSLNNPSAKYEVRETPGKEKKSMTLYGRQKMFTQQISDGKAYVPGPRYSPNDRKLYNTIGLNERNFSFGQRLDLSSPANNYPGPQYTLRSFCDKFKAEKQNFIQNF